MQFKSNALLLVAAALAILICLPADTQPANSAPGSPDRHNNNRRPFVAAIADEVIE
jgi:hypothetical protein